MLELSQSLVDFENVQMGSVRGTSIALTNRGSDSVAIRLWGKPAAPLDHRRKKDFPGQDFSVRCSAGNQVLEPGEQASLEVRFTPRRYGYRRVVLEVGSFPGDDNALLDLRGWGCPPEPYAVIEAALPEREGGRHYHVCVTSPGFLEAMRAEGETAFGFVAVPAMSFNNTVTEDWQLRSGDVFLSAEASLLGRNLVVNCFMLRKIDPQNHMIRVHSDIADMKTIESIQYALRHALTNPQREHGNCVHCCPGTRRSRGFRRGEIVSVLTESGKGEEVPTGDRVLVVSPEPVAAQVSRRHSDEARVLVVDVDAIRDGDRNRFYGICSRTDHYLLSYPLRLFPERRLRRLEPPVKVGDDEMALLIERCLAALAL